jgi:hypothetical protein
VQHEFVKVLNSKASHEQFVNLAENKANKIDFELQMQAVDIIHKQIVQMAVLIVEYIKHGIEVKKESKVEKQQRLKFLLSQASSLVHWIVQFDPQNVNAKDLYLPPDLQDLYNYSEKIIRKLPDFLRETI